MPSYGEGATDEGALVLSVRGEAAETVDPDLAILNVGLLAGGQTKAEASIEGGRLLDAVEAGLSTLGGVASSRDTADLPLTWSAPSLTSYPEVDKESVTGRMLTAIEFRIYVRDFDLMDAIQAVLDGHPMANLQRVFWTVDRTNPAWRSARLAAIEDSVTKARDYAAALGGQLVRIEHLADTGQPPGRAFAAAGGGHEPRGPRLDPVPQTVSAAVEARFVASGVTLPG